MSWKHRIRRKVWTLRPQSAQLFFPRCISSSLVGHVFGFHEDPDRLRLPIINSTQCLWGTLECCFVSSPSCAAVSVTMFQMFGCILLLCLGRTAFSNIHTLETRGKAERGSASPPRSRSLMNGKISTKDFSMQSQVVLVIRSLTVAESMTLLKKCA